MILLYIFILGCFVMSIVAVGLLVAFASVGYGDVYEAEGESSGDAAQARRILQPEASPPESQERSAALNSVQQEDL
jgi:hypothetical protein